MQGCRVVRTLGLGEQLRIIRAEMSQPPGPTDDEFAPTGTRPASLWPASTRAAERPSTGFASTRFDPLAEERARLQAQAAAAFDVCHPAWRCARCCWCRLRWPSWRWPVRTAWPIGARARPC
jgi:hypothetical protein